MKTNDTCISKVIPAFNLLSAALVPLILCATSNLRAEVVTFNFDSSDDEQTVITATDAPSGVTLTLLNPSPRTTFKADSDGLAVGSQGAFLSGADLLSFQLQVTGAAITLKSYEVGFSNSGAQNATFSMSGGSGSSSGNPLGSTGITNANGNWSLAPSQTGTLTASGFAPSGLAQFSSMTFDYAPVTSAVPEPSGALGLAGLIAGSAFLRRRKAA